MLNNEECSDDSRGNSSTPRTFLDDLLEMAHGVKASFTSKKEDNVLGRLEVASFDEIKLSNEIGGRHRITPREFILLTIIYGLIRTNAPDGMATFISDSTLERFKNCGGVLESVQTPSGFIIKVSDK